RLEHGDASALAFSVFAVDVIDRRKSKRLRILLDHPVDLIALVSGANKAAMHLRRHLLAVEHPAEAIVVAQLHDELGVRIRIGQRTPDVLTHLDDGAHKTSRASGHHNSRVNSPQKQAFYRADPR